MIDHLKTSNSCMFAVYIMAWNVSGKFDLKSNHILTVDYFLCLQCFLNVPAAGEMKSHVTN